MEIIDPDDDSQAIESPEWHREIIEDTLRRVKSGELKFMSSDEAWADIERRCQ